MLLNMAVFLDVVGLGYFLRVVGYDYFSRVLFKCAELLGAI
jgi:hypothetical protein